MTDTAEAELRRLEEGFLTAIVGNDAEAIGKFMSAVAQDWRTPGWVRLTPLLTPGR